MIPAPSRRIRCTMSKQAIMIALAFAAVMAAGPAAPGDDQIEDPSQMIFRFSPDVTALSYKAAQRGLAYLAAHQNADGSWTGDAGFKLNQDYEVTKHSVPHVGVTALAGLAFLSGGHLPDRGRYARNIAIWPGLRSGSQRDAVASSRAK